MNTFEKAFGTAMGALHLGENGHGPKQVEYSFLTRCDRCHRVTMCRRISSEEKPLEPIFDCGKHGVESHLPKPRPLTSLPIGGF